MKAIINITDTMLNKSICDCNKDVRELLSTKGIIDYNDLEVGEKEKIDARLKIDNNKTLDCVVSCYRAKGRGDKRIWITKVRGHGEVGNKLVFQVRSKKLHIQLTK